MLVGMRWLACSAAERPTPPVVYRVATSSSFSLPPQKEALAPMGSSSRSCR